MLGKWADNPCKLGSGCRVQKKRIPEGRSGSGEGVMERRAVEAGRSNRSSRSSNWQVSAASLPVIVGQAKPGLPKGIA